MTCLSRQAAASQRPLHGKAYPYGPGRSRSFKSAELAILGGVDRFNGRLPLEPTGNIQPAVSISSNTSQAGGFIDSLSGANGSAGRLMTQCR